MTSTIFLALMCISITVISAKHAIPSTTQDFLNSVNVKAAVNLKNSVQNGSLNEMFPGLAGNVVVTQIGNKILKVAGDALTNGTLLIQGESYMTLFDPSDIRDPVALLQKISTAKKRPVSVSVPVSDPYFIFSAPRALDKITGRGTIKDIKSGALQEVLKLQRVKRHHPTALSSVLARLQSYALVPIKTSTGATRYLLLKDPKFIVYKKDKQQTTGNQPQSNVKPQSTLTGGSAQVPGITPAPAAASPVVAKKPWLVTSLKDKNGIVAIGRMPPEAGGGGLTAASQANIVQSAPPATKAEQEPTPAPIIPPAPAVTPTPDPGKNENIETTPTPEPVVNENTATTPAPIVETFAASSTNTENSQAIGNFENARADAMQKLTAVITNNAEKIDVVNFAKALLNTMKTLNVLVVKYGENRETANFAQSMLFGMRKLDEIYKTGIKQDVVTFARLLVDTIKQFNVASVAPIMKETTPTPTPTTSEATTEIPTTTDIPAEYDPPTTTEEYEYEELMTSTPDYMGVSPAGVADPYMFVPTTRSPPPVGVAGWKGPTTEPALGPLDRINTTDVPEEIEAKPDKTPAEKRAEFLKMNPHLRGKLRKLRKKKKTTPAPPTTTTTAKAVPSPNNAATSGQSANNGANNKAKNVKSVLESLILRRNKQKGKQKLKISGSQSTITAPEPRPRPQYRRPRPRKPRPMSPFYRRMNLMYHLNTLRNPWMYLMGYS